MDLSPAQAKMAARAAALAQEQALRKAQPVVDTRQLGGGGLTQIPLQQRQDQINQVSSGYQFGSGLSTVPLADRQAAINAAQGGPNSYYGQDLTMTPLADRQAAINQQQQQLFGYQRPQGPVNPLALNMMPQRAPQPGPGPGQRPPQMSRPPQQRPQQPRGPVAPQGRPEPSFLQQALTYAKPVTQGIGALSSLFSLF